MEKAKFYEEMQFDNYAYATEVKAVAEEQLRLVSSVWLLSIIGSICGVMSWQLGVVFNLEGLDNWAMIVSFVIACICYHKIGGFLVAAKWSWNFAKFGWLVVPYFPIDLCFGMGCFFVGLFVFFFLPFFVVRHYKKQAEKNIEAADEYLRFCRPQNVVQAD